MVGSQAHVDAALAELKKQETDPDAILELCLTLR